MTRRLTDGTYHFIFLPKGWQSKVRRSLPFLRPRHFRLIKYLVASDLVYIQQKGGGSVDLLLRVVGAAPTWRRSSDPLPVGAASTWRPVNPEKPTRVTKIVVIASLENMFILNSWNFSLYVNGPATGFDFLEPWREPVFIPNLYSHSTAVHRFTEPNIRDQHMLLILTHMEVPRAPSSEVLPLLLATNLLEPRGIVDLAWTWTALEGYNRQTCNLFPRAYLRYRDSTTNRLDERSLRSDGQAPHTVYTTVNHVRYMYESV
jgi:hypothetical protein